MLTIRASEQTRQTIRRMEKRTDAYSEALARGMRAAAALGEAHTVEHKLNAPYQSDGTFGKAPAGQLRKRSGTLAASLRVLAEKRRGKDVVIIIGVPPDSPAAKYAYLLGKESVTITPTKGRALAIPTPAALTPTGQPRYAGPKDFERQTGQKLFAIRRPGKPPLLAVSMYRRKVSVGVQVMFVLVRSVTVEGTGALEAGFTEAKPEMVGVVQDELNAIARGSDG